MNGPFDDVVTEKAVTQMVDWEAELGAVIGVDRVGQAEELRHHGADIVVEDLDVLMEAA